MSRALGEALVVYARPNEPPVDLRAYYDQLVEALGSPVPIDEDYASGGRPTGRRWLEIRYDADIPDMAAFRHSKNAQPLHTDESYIADQANLMFFYCERDAPAGGETIFVSGLELCEYLRAEKPALYDELVSQPVRYTKAYNSREATIISWSEDALPSLNFNYFCADGDQPAAALELNERFHRFLEDELPRRLIAEVPLAPGEAVAWWDHRVLHGRNAFEASRSNERFIWKTGIRLGSAA